MKIILLFIDGFGLGTATGNPIYSAPTPFWNEVLGYKALVKTTVPLQSSIASLVATDATMGVPGIPQSATGQATLFTGKNVPQIIGRHVSGYPGPAIRKILAEDNIYTMLQRKNLSGTYANAYQDTWFVKPLNWRFCSVTTVAALKAGQSLRRVSQIASGGAVYQDITSELLIERGFAVSSITPKQAAMNLVNIAGDHDLTVFEYFQTDIIGHRQDWDRALEIVSLLDALCEGIYSHMDGQTLLVITSDHGNIEDITTKGHTLNNIPTLAIGTGHEQFTKHVTNLADIAPAIISWLTRCTF